jgi:hypothetical protein
LLLQQLVTNLQQQQQNADGIQEQAPVEITPSNPKVSTAKEVIEQEGL